MANPMPWWACIALALVGVEYTRNASILDASYAASYAGADADDAAPRQLARAAEDDGATSAGTSSLVPGVEYTRNNNADDAGSSLGASALSPHDDGVEYTRDSNADDAGSSLGASALPPHDDGVQYIRSASALGASHGAAGAAAPRRLAPSPDGGYLAPSANESSPAPVPMEFHVMVPCLSFLGFMQVMEPCGNLTVPEDGINFSTPFASFHMPGTRKLKKEVLGMERQLSQYTVLFVLAGVLTWVGSTLLVSSRRQRARRVLRDTLQGKLYIEEEDEEEPPTEEERRARLDPLSNEFIAPGNIYRLLGVLHPGIVGVWSWSWHAAKALICAYMQLYLPCNVIRSVLVSWHFVGIKSPLWFVAHATTFASMVAALGSLCSMFAGKCAKSIRDGAEANAHILSHRAPSSSAAATAPRGGARARELQELDPENLEARDSDPRTPASPTTATALLEAPVPSTTSFPPWAIRWNELFWCSTSMGLNILMSLMLEAAMFLKVATFTGDVGNVAVTAVSLYFIFDLDDKVMEADPKLKLKYRHAVVRQTEEVPEESRPFILPIVASTSAALVRLTVPFGLMGIVLFAWRNKHTGFVIGGDGLTM